MELVSSLLGGFFAGWGGFGCGVGGGVGALEVGVAGQGVVGFAVYEETDLCDLGQGGVEGSDDGLDGEVFDEDAGGVVVGEGAAEVDDGLVVEEEDVVDGGAGLEGVGGGGEGVLGDEVVEEDAGADAGVLGEGDLGAGGGDGAVGVAGEVEGDVFGAGGGGRGDRGGVVEGGEALVGLLAAVEKEGRHEGDAADEDPEEDALVAGIIGGLLPGLRWRCGCGRRLGRWRWPGRLVAGRRRRLRGCRGLRGRARWRRRGR